MSEAIQEVIERTVNELFSSDVSIILSRPDEQFGDYSSNIAMKLAAKLDKNPYEVAEKLVEKLRKHAGFSEVTVAKPGFINIKLTDASLVELIDQPTAPRTDSLLLEYSCPNPFKELHVGHLYQTILGDSLARVYERFGTKVYRINYGGDVGRHVAMSMWAILQKLEGAHPEKLGDVPIEKRPGWLSELYVVGAAADESDEKARLEITKLNDQIYKIHENNDQDSPLAKIYWQCREWSYDYFKQFYQDIDVVAFDQFIGESEAFELGLKIVKSHIGDVFTNSDGAIVLPKSKSGLHTRVFITSALLPTYEAKDLGVIRLEADTYDYEKRIIMSGNDQAEYMKVVFAAQQFIDPKLGAKQYSLAHGIVKFSDGQKMSSRLGNVTRATDVLAAAKQAAPDNNPDIALGAVKYAFLKNSIGGDITFDLEQSVNLEGNSGPYLQYALVRTRSILQKVGADDAEVTIDSLDEYERSLANWLGRYNETLQLCITDNSLHHLCAYLYETSQVFSRFYENSPVIGSKRLAIRRLLLTKYEKILSDGLDLLGMPKPESM